MMKDQVGERGRNLLDKMLGPERARETLEHWRQINPDFGQYLSDFVFGEIWSRPGLEPRTKSLVTIAVCAATSRPRALELNIRMALKNGATRQEIVETFLHLAPYAGFPACWEGLEVADKVFHEGQSDK